MYVLRCWLWNGVIWIKLAGFSLNDGGGDVSTDRKSLLMVALMMFFLIVVWAYKTAELKNEIEQLKFEASFRVRQRDYHLETMDYNFEREDLN